MHEMMHAFMYDYNRYLMFNEGVLWFIEGIASCVDNSYQYRNHAFEQLYDYNSQTGNYDIYTEYSVISGFQDNPQFFCMAMPEESPYISGYLATAYLAYMDCIDRDGGDYVISPEGDVDTDKLLDGLNDILGRLHEGETLDDIIDDISDHAYQGADDLRDHFVWDYIAEVQDNASLEFCVNFLNYMEAQSSENLPAHGSLLRREQQYISPLDWDSEAESEVFHIAESGDYVYTSVDPASPWNTGGVYDVGNYDEIREGEWFSESSKIASGNDIYEGDLTAESLETDEPANAEEEKTDVIPEPNDIQTELSPVADADDVMTEEMAQVDTFSDAEDLSPADMMETEAETETKTYSSMEDDGNVITEDTEETEDGTVDSGSECLEEENTESEEH